MRLTQRTAAAVLVGAGLVTGAAVVATPAQAAVSHRAHARADWITGSRVAAAEENRYWSAARRELAQYGHRYTVQRENLATLIAIPLTDTTQRQRAAATRATRELNSFFHTSGLYGVKPAGHRAAAKQEWLASFRGAAAEQSRHLDAAIRELSKDGDRYAQQSTRLAELAAIPLTDATAAQQTRAATLVASLNAFFGTHVG